MTTSGHLRLPNDLVEVLARLRLNGTQWQILFALWRREGQTTIGIVDIVEATGVYEAQVKREMASLVKMNLILRHKAAGGRGHKTMTIFNLDMSTWRVQLKEPPAIKHKKPIPRRLRWQVWERDNFTCQHCGTRSHLTTDHIIPEDKGGLTTLNNLQTLCQSCNSRKGTR